MNVVLRRIPILPPYRAFLTLLPGLLGIGRRSWTLLFALCLGAESALGQGTLEVSKSIQGGLTSVTSGTEYTYILNYRYASQTQNGQNVKLEDNLDPDLSWTAAEVVMGGSTHIASMAYTAATGKAVWTFVNPLPAGSSGQLTLKVRFKSGVTPNGTVATNSVVMTANNASTVHSSTVSISATAAYLQTALKTRSSGGTPGFNTVYTVAIRNPSGGTVGALALTNATVVDTLPVGAEFVSASGGGTYSAGTHQVTWANVTAAVGSNNSGFSQTVTVRYPTPTFSVGQNVCNDMTVTGTAVGLVPVSLSDQECNLLINATPAITSFSKTSTDTTPEVGQNFDYRITFSNTGSVPVTNYVIEDPVPSKLTVTQVRAVLVTGNVNTRVFYERSDNPGAWVEFSGSPATVSTNINAPTLPGGIWINRLRWELGTLPQGYVSPTGSSSVRYAATVLSTDRLGNPVVVGGTFTNCATMAYSFNSTNYAGTNCVTSTIVGPVGVFANPEALKSMTGTFVPGAEIPITLTVRNRSGCTDGLVNPVIADLLPTQLEYVAGSATASGLASPTSVEPQVLPNYGTSGRTLLRWTYNATLPAATTAPAGNKDASVSFRAKVKAGTLPAIYSNTNRAFVGGWANTGSVTIQSSTQDVFDVDGDGSTVDQVAQSSATSFTIGSSASLDSYKYVKGQLDADWSRYPVSGRTSPGGTADYRLVVQNSGNVTLTNLAIVDILPAVADTGVVDLSSRLSEWTPFLAGPVSAPSGVTVYYSTAMNPQRDDMGDPDPFPAGSTAPNWSAVPPSDITTVRSVRFDFGTRVLAPLDQFELRWPMRAPVDSPTGGEIAWNSFGVVARRLDNSLLLLPTEPIKVGISVEPIQPAGYGSFVWLDTDRDGLQDSGEPGLDGVRVELYRDDGDGIANPAVDTFVGFTLTSGGGQYVFSFLPAGTYFAVFHRPPTYSTSAANAGSSDEEDSDGVPGTLHGLAVTVTPLTELVLGEIDLSWDQGFYQPAVPVAAVGNYVWFDEDADGGQDEASANGLNGVTVRLYNGSAVLQGTTTTANDANGNPGFYLFDGLTPGSYQIEFVLPNGFTFTTRGPTGSSDTIDSDPDTTLGRTEVFSLSAGAYDASWDAGMRLPTGILSLGDRVWIDANGNGIYEPGLGEVGVDGVILNLYRDMDDNGLLTPGTDQFFATTTTFTRTGAPGYYAFANLPAGAYVVQVDPANLIGGGALANTQSTTGNGTAPDPDNNVNDDDQGEPMVGQGVVSQAILLATGTEPGTDGNDNPTLDFGFLVPAALGNRVWLDLDNDGLFEPGDGETGINGVAVELYFDANHDGDFADAGETTPFATTATANSAGADGIYGFASLAPGSYYVRLPSPPTASPLSSTVSDPADNREDNDDNGAQTESGQPVSSPVIALGSGETDDTIDFGLLGGLDFGDLEDGAAGTAPGNYRTRLADGGPFHRVFPGGGFRLGASIDAEGGGLQNGSATADDAADTGAADDEDGVAPPAGTLLTGTTRPVAVTLGANTPAFTAYLNLWIDYNGDGDFDDAVGGESEWVAANTVLTEPGVTQVMMRIPSSALVEAPVGLRVRLSNIPLSGADGDGGYGEVEDQLLVFTESHANPTLALVTDLEARRFAERAIVGWRTAHEAGSLAFQLVRLEPVTDAWVVVNTEPLPASGNPAGAGYRVVDPGVDAGQTVTYAVVEFDDSGSRIQHGPFVVEVQADSGGGPDKPPVDSHPTAGADGQTGSGVITGATPVTARPAGSGPAGAGGSQTSPGSTGGSSGGSTVLPSLAAYLKVPVGGAGMHFVSTRELMRVSGRPESFWLDLLRRQVVGLSLGGRQVPLLMAEGGAGIFFYGEAPKSLFASQRWYWLTGQPNLVVPTVDGGSPSEPGLLAHRARLDAEEDRLAVTVLTTDPSADYWMWRKLGTLAGMESEVSFPVSLPDLEAAGLDGLARVAIGLHGGDAGTRRVTATLVNGLGTTPLGSVTWAGKVPATLDVRVAAAGLVAGENTLVVRAERPEPGQVSVVYLDKYSVSYPATPRASAGRLFLGAEADGVHTVSGFVSRDATVLDVSEPERPARLTGVTVTGGEGDWSASFVAQAGHRYLAFEPAGAIAVSGLGSALRPSLEMSRNRAQYVILTPSALAEPARELAEYRKGQGLSTLVLTLAHVADEFGGGVVSPEAIRRFLQAALSKWAVPPRYVLLFGDGTYDYRDLGGQHDNLMPPEMLPTGWGLYASDALGGDVDGDGRVDVSVGRLPVGTVEQGYQMVAKIRNQERMLGTSPRRALLVADQPDTAGNFTAAEESIRALVEPALATSTAYRSELGGATAVQRRILEALSADLDWMDYAGHGGHDRLGVSGYLRTGDVALLGNAGKRLPVVTAMTCAVGNFAVPGNDPLGESLVLAADRGAIAVWAPSGLSLDAAAQVLNREFARRLAGAPAGARLGDLIRESMRAYREARGPTEILAIYNLLGDPALLVR